MRRIFGSLGLVLVLMLTIVSSALAARPASAFASSWEGVDPFDGSNLSLTIVGNTTIQAVLVDDNATGACGGAATSTFVGVLIGKVSGSEMVTRITAAKCGTQPVTFVIGAAIDWWLDDGGNADPSDDVLYNSFGEEYTRTT